MQLDQQKLIFRACFFNSGRLSACGARAEREIEWRERVKSRRTKSERVCSTPLFDVEKLSCSLTFHHQPSFSFFHLHISCPRARDRSTLLSHTLFSPPGSLLSSQAAEKGSTFFFFFDPKKKRAEVPSNVSLFDDPPFFCPSTSSSSPALSWPSEDAGTTSTSRSTTRSCCSVTWRCVCV